jgi:hypothetical protein
MNVLKSKAAHTKRFGVSYVKTGTIWYIDLYLGKTTYMIMF